MKLTKKQKVSRKYHKDHKEQESLYHKEYYIKNKEKVTKSNLKWRKEHPEQNKAIATEWRENNRDKFKVYKAKFLSVGANKEKAKVTRKAYIKNLLETDIAFKIGYNLRARLRRAIKIEQKVGSAVRDLGCSIQHLKLHLELFFDKGMTWDNYGHSGWHIDHIKPLSSFDLTDRKQFLEANNYKNLQPLWSKDNYSKGKDM
jgi:hypothetical protein